MLAHKVDGEHPANYSNLLLPAQKLERGAESRDPPPPKMTATSWLNMTHSQMPGNLFPSHKLKGKCTFATWTMTVGKDEAKEDPGEKPEGVGETEPSADKDMEVSGGIGEINQSIEYIVCFVKVVKLYQKKNGNCFGCRCPEHLVWDCPKDASRSAHKVCFNTKKGMAKKGGWTLQKSAVAQWTSLDNTPWTWEHLKRLPSWTKTHLPTGVDQKT